MSQTLKPQNDLDKTRKMEKKPIKKIVTLVTQSGEIYQKIKINDTCMTYEDLLYYIKKPPMKSKNPHGYRLQLTGIILSTIEGDPIKNENIVKSGKIRVGFKIKKILNISDIFLKFEKFPEDLNELHIDCGPYQHRLPNFPKNLDTLSFGFTIHPITGLPESLKKLIVNGGYSHVLPNLPEGLETLRVGHWYKYVNSVPRETETLKVVFCDYRDY